jgi:hypothetical protein
MPTDSGACPTSVEIDGAGWCIATDRDIIYGAHPVGTRVVMLDLALSELWGRDAYIAVVPDCGGQYCGAMLDSATITFPDDPLPPLDVAIDVWGHTTAEGMTAAGFRLR